MGFRVPIEASTMLGLISFTPPTFIPPFEPPDTSSAEVLPLRPWPEAAGCEGSLWSLQGLGFRVSGNWKVGDNGKRKWKLL